MQTNVKSVYLANSIITQISKINTSSWIWIDAYIPSRFRLTLLL